jgi:geranylgeranyl reductase family protein
MPFYYLHFYTIPIQLSQSPQLTTDVLIAGAGPGGASTSIFLSKENIPHIIIDKAVFPRDKICGDAFSAKSVGMLKRITADWQQYFLDDNNKAIVSSGIQFIASNNVVLDIPFALKNIDETNPPGFVSRRIDFDNTLSGLIDQRYATFLMDTSLEAIEEKEDGLLVTIKQKGEQKIIFTKMIVGAEGRSSIVAKKMAKHIMEPAHYSAGIRAYYKNVSGLHHNNYIELHFLKELQPGYLWIFPLPNGAANVGVGMLSKSISASKANLKQLMLDAIATHPNIKHRFTNAVIEGQIEGWGLPLGSKKRKLSGNRFLLTGDAGSLIDPFTGEGIGNAMVSGLVASRIIKKAIAANDFSAAVLQQYDRDLYKKLWTELKLSHYLQLLTSKPRLFNFVIGKASRSKELRETISCMFENVDIRKKFTNPLFYLKILFNR